MQTNLKKNTSFFERILQIVDYYDIKSINNFAKDFLGYSAAEKINRLKRDGTSPSYDILVDITNKFESINPDWLLTGKGEMLKADNKAVAVPAASGQGIPLIPTSAIAGMFSGSEPVFEYECERFIVPTFRDAEFLISVKGDSMTPHYNTGDIIACKKLPMDTFFQWNKIYVIDTEQGPLIKRIRSGSTSDHIELVSDNQTYPPFEIHRSKIYHIALVIGVIRLE